MAFTCSSVFAQQNRIHNGDFEEYNTCPTYISTPGDYQIEHCTWWKSPTYATSDYFNACAKWPASVPLNALGFQYSFSGNGYCGIQLIYCNNCPDKGFWYEYIQGRLIMPLIAGKKYGLTCHLALSNTIFEFGFWKFGAYFSSQPISKIDAKPLAFIPQILNVENNYIFDTLNWIEIKGEFIAVGGEEYITLGFFPDTLALDTLKFPGYPFLIDPEFFRSYYYIDGCALYEDTTQFLVPNVFTPNGDGINDLFKICVPGITGLKCSIYNRWGKEIYYWESPNGGWGGRTISETDVPEGVYYFVASITTNNNDTILKGFFHLIR